MRRYARQVRRCAVRRLGEGWQVDETTSFRGRFTGFGSVGMSRTPYVSGVVASLTALERERVSIPELRFTKRRKSILSKLTSRSGLSTESRVGLAILVQAAFAGAIILGLKLSPESRVAIVAPVLAVAVVVALIVIRGLRSRQAYRRPERLQAVRELVTLELLTAQEAEELRSSIEVENGS